eukprot:1907564-Pyramimonas_sp.AAC.1
MLMMTEGTVLGTIIQDEFDLLTYSDVVQLLNKTPKAANLKPVRRVLRNGRCEVRHPFAARKFPKLIVYTEQSTAVRKTILNSNQAFEQQTDMCVRAA